MGAIENNPRQIIRTKLVLNISGFSCSNKYLKDPTWIPKNCILVYQIDMLEGALIEEYQSIFSKFRWLALYQKNRSLNPFCWNTTYYSTPRYSPKEKQLIHWVFSHGEWYSWWWKLKCYDCTMHIWWILKNGLFSKVLRLSFMHAFRHRLFC